MATATPTEYAAMSPAANVKRRLSRAMSRTSAFTSKCEDGAAVRRFRFDAAPSVDPAGVMNPGFVGNRVVTSQYTLLNFIPLNAFKQFKRLVNVYFLALAFLQTWKRVSVTGGVATLILPLGFVLAISAAKDAYEDYRRHQVDAVENGRTTRVRRGGNGAGNGGGAGGPAGDGASAAVDPGADGGWREVPWRDVRVGDVVLVRNREIIPADLVMLATSDPHNLVFVMTANLDGETNLKLRQVHHELPRPGGGGGNGGSAPGAPGAPGAPPRGTVECALPNKRLDLFAGTITLRGAGGGAGKQVAVGPKNMLLRGCQLRNAAWATGVVVYTGHESKIMKNAAPTPFKVSTYLRMANYELPFVFPSCFQHVWRGRRREKEGAGAANGNGALGARMVRSGQAATGAQIASARSTLRSRFSTFFSASPCPHRNRATCRAPH